MKSVIFFLSATLALSIAAPGNYYHQYQRTTSAYQNSELQHKKDEEGYYSRMEDQQNYETPREYRHYIHNEYHAPTSYDQYIPSSSHNGVKSGRRYYNQYENQNSFPSYHEGYSHQYHGGYYPKKSGSDSSYSHTYNQPTVSNPTPSGSTSKTDDQLISLDDVPFDYSKFKQFGFGTDYLENTEKQPEVIKPVYEGSEYLPPVQKPYSGSHTYNTQNNNNNNEDRLRTIYDKIDKIGKELDTEQHNYDKYPSQETQQTQLGFDEVNDNKHDSNHHLDQMATSFGQVEFNSQMKKNNEESDFGVQKPEELPKPFVITQQTEKNFIPDQQHENMDQKTEDVFDTQKEEDLNKETQQKEEMNQNTEDVYDKFEFGTQQKEEGFNQQTEKVFIISEQKNEEMNQKTEDVFDNFEFGTQQKEEGFNQQTDKNFIPEQKNEEMSQKTEDVFTNTEFGTQQKEEDFNQQTEKVFIIPEEKNEEMKQMIDEIFEQKNEESLTQTYDMNQQTEKIFTAIETGDQKHKDVTENIEDSFKNMEFTPQKDESFNQQTDKIFNVFQTDQQEDGYTETFDFNQQQTDSGFEMNKKNEDVAQKNEYEYEPQTDFTQSEDMTQQQSQIEYEDHKFEHQNQQEPEKEYKNVHFSDQNREEYGNWEKSQTETEDMNQQHETGHFEFGSQNKDDTQKEEDMGIIPLKNYDTSSERNNHHYHHGWKTYESSKTRTSTSSYSTQSSNYGSYHRSHDNVHYGTIRRIPDEEKIEQLPQEIPSEDVSQKTLSLNLEAPKNDEDFNHKLTQEILSENKEYFPETVEPKVTQKPGFWKRLGGSIASTYESAKEKTKHLADKVKHKLG